jgi:hypothetical protein
MGSPARGRRLPRRRSQRRLAAGVGAAVLAAALAAGALWWANRSPGVGKPGAPPDPFPAGLRHREYDTQIMLQRRDFTPVWSRHLCGPGYCKALAPNGLNMFSPPGETPTLYALDDDPERRWFEFSIKAGQIQGERKGRYGVFFGWRRRGDGTGADGRCFLVEIKETAEGPPAAGQVRVLIAQLGDDDDRGALTRLEPLPQGKGTAALPARPAGGWREVQVRAVDHKVTVTVGTASVVFDVRDVKGKLLSGPGGLDARGALGIWTAEGPAFFRDAAVLALRSENER